MLLSTIAAITCITILSSVVILLLIEQNHKNNALKLLKKQKLEEKRKFESQITKLQKELKKNTKKIAEKTYRKPKASTSKKNLRSRTPKKRGST